MHERLTLRTGPETAEIPDSAGNPAADPIGDAVTRRRLLRGALAAGAALACAPVAAAAEPASGKKVRTGVIGCGSVSGSYLPVLAASPFVELVSACDIIVERAQERARRFQIPNVFPNIDEMLAGPRFDLLVNLTSMPSHHPVNRKGLEAGRHVWSEKPLAVRYEDAKELLVLAAEKKVGLWGAPITVLSPQFRFMAETLASGKLGKVTAAHAHYGHEGHLWSAWFFQKGGGSLYDLGVYNVTSLTGLLGPATAVVGMTSICRPTRTLTDGTEVKVEVADNEMLIMDHSSGVLSHVQSGYNYGSAGVGIDQDVFDTDHARVPSRIMIQTESYPLEAFKSWMDVLDHPWLLGDFVWTAVDYIGEASIGWRGYWQEQGFYPWNLAFCGDIDVCGWKRPQSYYRDALWKENQLSIFVTPPVPSFEENRDRQPWSKWHWLDAVADWNWTGYEGRPLQVSAYSSCEEVELFLNARSLGRKKTDRASKFMAAWDVPYAAGALKAVGYRGGRQVASAALETAGDVARMALAADRDRIRSDGQDLSYVTIELRDARGTIHPKADNLLTFRIEGPGTIAGVGSANPVSVESYQKPERKAWRGRCLVIVKSTTEPGEIRLRASAAGLPPAEIVVRSAAPPR